MTDLATRYRLQQALSWTSAARTFAGKHPESGEKVAVKVLALADHAHADRLRARFESTASILAGLSHPALPDLIDHGISERNEAYLVTRWFPGAKLSELELAPGDLLVVVLQVTEALESLALHGLVHLGVAADNVLVMPDLQAQLTGWGSSLLNVDWQSGPGLSLSSANDHTAPELRQSGGKADALWRADSFSLASMTAELLGAVVDESAGAAQVRFPGELSRQISGPEALRATLEQCLAADPDQRPDAYSVLTKAIQRAVPRDRQQHVAATQPMPPLRAPSRPADVDSSPPPADGATGAGGEDEATKVGAGASSIPPLPPLPDPSADQELAADPPTAEARNQAPSAASQDEDSSDTGVQAIRQESGTFLLPKSSSVEEERLFEASELANFLNEESLSEVIPPEPPGPETEVESGSKDIDDNTTAEIKVPVEAVPEEVVSDEEGALEPPLIAPNAATEMVSPSRLRAMVEAASEPSSAEDPSTEDPSTEDPAAGDPAAGDPAAGEAATELVSPDKLGEMVAAASEPEDEGETPGVAAEDAATELVSPERLEDLVAAARTENQESADDAGPISPPLQPHAEVEVPAPASEAPETSADAPPPAATATEPSVSEDGSATDEPPPVGSIPASTPRPTATAGEAAVRDDQPEGEKADIGAASPASTVVASSAEVREMLAHAAEQGGGVAVPAEVPPSGLPADAAAALSAAKAAHAKSPASGRSVPRWVLAAAVLVGLVLVATLVAGLLRRDPPVEELPPAPVVAAPVLAEPPAPELDPEMEQALILLGDGDWDQARPIIAALRERAEAGELADADLDALQSASETLTLGYGEQVAQLLGEALEQLDVNGMRSALRGGTAAVEALRRRPGGEDLLRRSRTVLRAVDSFRSALDRGEGTEALERSLELQSLEPELAERFRAVERSHSQIEDRVVSLMDAAEYAEARLVLERAEQITSLPDSLRVLKAGVVQAMREESALGNLLARAEEHGRQNRPHLGLGLLEPSNIPATQRGRANELRTRLQRQFEQLDAGAPSIEFLDEAELRKDAPYDIRLRVSDDYGVNEVRVQVRTEGAPNARAVAVRALGGEEYVAKIPESLHDGKPIQFWAAAVDRSGHLARLGSETEPIEVRRRRWFQVFRRRGDG